MLQRLLQAVDQETLQCKLFCFWNSGGTACFYAFLPLAYSRLGLQPSSIGLLVGLAPLFRCVSSPLWGAFADARQAHRAVLCTSVALASALHCLLPACPPSLLVLLPLVFFAESAVAPTGPLADAAIGLTLARLGRPFTDYGRQRLWGAVSWGFVFAPLVGALQTFAPPRTATVAPYVLHVACNGLALAAALRLAQPSDAGPPKEGVQRRSLREVLTQCHAAVRATPGATLRLLLFCYLGAVMGTIDGFLFLWLSHLGGSDALLGLALTVTCVAETAVFYYAGAIQQRLGVRGCLHLVAACYITRLLWYSALPLLGSPWAVLPVQLCHGITFGLYWAVGNGYARTLAPGLEPSMQAVFAGLNSLGSFLGNTLGGLLVQRAGFRPLFLLLAAGCVLAAGALALQPGRSGAAAEEGVALAELRVGGGEEMEGLLGEAGAGSGGLQPECTAETEQR